MSIRTRINDAMFLYENGRHEGAFPMALVAVAASSRRECPDRSVKDSECFERFLQRRWPGSIAAEYHGECHPIQRILYKWFRCALVHEGGLPEDIELMDGEKFSIRAGGAPEHVLKLSRGWFHWLVRCVAEASCNADEFPLSSTDEGQSAAQSTTGVASS